MRKHIVTFEEKPYTLYSLDTAMSPYGRYEDYISMVLEKGHFQEESFLAYLKDTFGTIRSFVDVGANIGNHSVFAHEVMKASEVTCFEPMLAQFTALEMNCSGYATLHNVGLSDQEGTMAPRLAIMNDHRTGHEKIMSNSGGTRLVPGSTIPMKTLDSFHLTHIDILKIDVEGMEPEVLAGGLETIGRLHPVIYTEANEMATLVRCAALLMPLGYAVTHLKDYGNPMAEWRKV